VSVSDGLTRVNVRTDVEGESAVENAEGDLLGIVEAQVQVTSSASSS
jgi:hypothetical protein